MQKFLLPLLIICFIACKHAETNKVAFDFYPVIADSIREKYLWPATKTSLFFNLPPLYKGVDSFEIRIRPWDVFDLGINLYIFKVERTGWKGYHYNSHTLFHTSVRSPTDSFPVSFTDRHHTGDSVFMVKELTPLCGWKKFSDTLMSLNLATLPTQDSINKFKIKRVNDGGGYNIEISSPHSYRILKYVNPDLYQYEECKSISKLIAFLQRQIGKGYDWPYNQHGKAIQKTPPVAGFNNFSNIKDSK